MPDANRRALAELALRRDLIVVEDLAPETTVSRRMLERGDEFGARAERESKLRREVAAAALREYLPDWRWTMPQGGLSFWVTLPDGDAVTFSRVAAEHGVLVRPGAVAGGHPQAGPGVGGMQPECLATDGIDALGQRVTGMDAGNWHARTGAGRGGGVA